METYFRVFAFRVVRALAMDFTSGFEIIRVADQSGRTYAFTEHASGPNAAFNVVALVLAFSVFAIIPVTDETNNN